MLIARGAGAADPLLLLATDPAVSAAVRAATDRMGRAPARLLGNAREALSWLIAPGPRSYHLRCDPAGVQPGPILTSLAEPGHGARVILVSSTASPAASTGTATIPADAAQAASGAARPPPYLPPPCLPPPRFLPEDAAAALRDGLARGEISVQYQPVVRLADRRPVMVEALARWHRRPTAIPPDSFVPLAERSGLVRALSMVVAGRAARDIGPLWQGMRLAVSLNLPLGLLMQADLPGWLGRSLAAGGMAPRHVTIELTETTEVLDRSTLRRALQRLRAAGYRVLLDDLVLRDDRGWLLGLPFAGFKLDRSLVETLPQDAAARAEVRRLARLAAAQGQLIVAEGVSDRRIWSALRGLGVHHAQGYLVSRPLPAAALPAWSARWRGRRVPMQG